MATLSSMMWVSKEELSRLFPAYEEELTVIPKKGFEGDEDPEPIKQWVNGRGKVGLPLDYALRVFDAKDIPFEENLSKGVKLVTRKRPDPHHHSAPAGQDVFFSDVIEAMTANYAVLAEAPTGSGKTVAALNAVAEFGRSTLVIVPRARLMYQWADEATDLLGLRESQIGFVGDGHETLDRPFTVCVIHNLFQTIYPQEFYKAFGIVIWDECHGLGAREFNKSTRLFSPSFRLAVSATPDRKDGCEALFFNCFGKVSVRSEQKPLPLYYELVPFKLTKIPGSLNYCNSTSKPLRWLAEHEERNKLVVSLIQKRFVEAKLSGQAVVVLTNYVDHAERLMEMCRMQGANRILESQMGLFVGAKTSVKKDGSLGKTKVKQVELDAVSENATVIFATYGMMREGIDIPRIGFGIEALPVADVRQAVGRARRKFNGRSRAYWTSIKDCGIRTGNKMTFLYNFTAARVKGLREIGGVTINDVAV